MADLERQLYAESEMNAYNNIDYSESNNNFNKNRRSITESDNHSIISYSTSAVYSEKRQKQTPQSTKLKTKYSDSTNLPSKNTKLSNNQPSLDSFAKEVYKYNAKPMNTSTHKPGGALTKKLKIRESVETDNSAAAMMVKSPSIRLSEIERKSVLTLRMFSVNESKQIRIKLYLPHVDNDETPQIVIVYVNKGTAMHLVKEFVQNNYPKNMLKDKIKQLCIADDDGEIDEDFPPISENQDITSLGVTNFWIDRVFGKEERRLSIVHSESMKERLLTPSSDTTRSDSEYTSTKCCWCCSKSKYQDLEDSRSQNITTIDSSYNPPTIYDRVQYAML